MSGEIMNIPGMETELNKNVLNPDLSDFELEKAGEGLRKVLAALESETK
jgi:hypothetical protein